MAVTSSSSPLRHGRGMTTEQQAKLFEELTKAEAADRSELRGHGARSLPSPAKLARLMAGDVTVTSERGKGSRVPCAAGRGGQPKQACGDHNGTLADHGRHLAEPDVRPNR